MIFLLALFLAFAKRRDDVLIYNETGMKVRKTVSRFNLSFLNAAIVIIASVTLVCYIMYTVSPEVILRLNSEHLYVTSVFVLLGILRYLQRILVDGASGSPTLYAIFPRLYAIFCVLAGETEKAPNSRCASAGGRGRYGKTSIGAGANYTEPCAAVPFPARAAFRTASSATH